MAVSSKLATLKELQEFYGPADLYALIEIIVVDAENQRIANRPER